jgi:arylformamidase
MSLYRGMDRAALDLAYNNSAAIGFDKRDAYFADWKRRSDATRAAHTLAQYDLRYGPSPRQRLDWYPVDKVRAPTLAYIHGGYWQGGDKADYGFISQGPNECGLNIAVVEYTLGPEKRMDGIVAEIRESVAWLIDNLAKLGGDPRRLFVSGHSAGGHLTAMAMAEPRLAGGLAISGLYDLEPIRLGVLNDKLGMDVDEAARNSPQRHLPETGAALIVTVGGNERPELQRQSREYYAAWTSRGLPGQWVDLPGHDHFSLLDELALPQGRLCVAVTRLAGAK